MPRKCAVPGCKWNSRQVDVDKRSLFKLPKDPIVAKRLLNQLQFEEDFQAVDSFRMCDKHFTADSFKSHGKLNKRTT
jgi:hypothetical protein